MIKNDEIALVFNTVEEKRSAIRDSYVIRREALHDQIPTYTTLAGARAAALGMAPNLSGVASADQARGVHLADLALEFAGRWLQPGGDLVVKLFQGEGFAQFRQSMQRRFDKVHVRKPAASRDRSREVFLVGKGFSNSGVGGDNPIF